MTCRAHSDTPPVALAARSISRCSAGVTRARTSTVFASPFGSLGRPIFGVFIVVAQIVVDQISFSWHNKSTRKRMAYNLSPEKQTAVVHALAEGNSIRAIERQTGIHRDTIMRLGVKIGKGCAVVMDATMRHLDCRVLQLDEIWGFIGMKQKRTTPEDRGAGMGDAWTFVAIDAESRMVPTFLVGLRDGYYANMFVEDLASRLNERPQLSTDGLAAYVDAIERGFGAEVDYGQVVKIYGAADINDQRRYSPAQLVEVKKRVIAGAPDEKLISTSYIERQNLTMRMHMRRLTRLTNGFSKKLENFKAAVALHFGYYNFVRIHRSLRMTPAMAGGVTNHIWTVPELMEAASE